MKNRMNVGAKAWCTETVGTVPRLPQYVTTFAGKQREKEGTNKLFRCLLMLYCRLVGQRPAKGNRDFSQLTVFLSSFDFRAGDFYGPTVTFVALRSH